MDMRHIESVHVNSAVVHVLDKRLEEPLVGIAELELTEDLHEFFMKHILRSLRSEEAEKARFIGEGATKRLIRRIFNDPESFIGCTQELARRLFAIMRPMESVGGGDLAIVTFNSGEARYLGLLKLDYHKAYSHEVAYENERFNVNVTVRDTGLPLTHQKLTACAFIKAYTTDDAYDLLLVEKAAVEEGPRFFLNRFLGASKVLDKRDTTKLFRKTVEQWTRTHLKNDLDKAMEVRRLLSEELLGSAYIDLKAFSEDLFSASSDAREKFQKKMQAVGLPLDEKLEVDRLWIDDAMKTRSVRTDTGFTLKGAHEFYDDPARFELKRNGDGSVDYVIKNVRNISES